MSPVPGIDFQNPADALIIEDKRALDLRSSVKEGAWAP